MMQARITVNQTRVIDGLIRNKGRQFTFDTLRGQPPDHFTLPAIQARLAKFGVDVHFRPGDSIEIKFCNRQSSTS